MNTSSVISSNTINAAIIRSYVYDHRNTDMACAWSTVYTLYAPETREIITEDVVTGCGKTIPDKYNIIPLTSEIKEDYLKKVEEDKIARAKMYFEDFQKELDEYNAKLLPQMKGQIVEIMTGRNKGKIGKITWMGKNKFGRFNTWNTNTNIKAAALLQIINHRPYKIPGSEFDLILIRPVDNSTWEDGKDKVYIDPSKCKVIKGYVPVTVTEEDAYSYGSIFDNFHEKWNMGYDETEYPVVK